MADSSHFQPPRGMRDFYPEDMRLRTRIFEAWHDAARKSGFDPYDACVVESLDLLKRKAGEEIVDQIYHFEDKSGRHLALRPEITPTLARMIAARQGALSFPLKWYTVGQCFRYERMTRGRKREHYQWNLDIIGEESVSAEAEILATAVSAMQTLGLQPDDYRIHFNSRALLSALLQKQGIPEAHHAATFLALDKRGKISDSEMAHLLVSNGIDAASSAKVLQLLDIHTLDEAISHVGCDCQAAIEIRQFLAFAEAHGIADALQFDIGVIRGLSYYTGIVFEGFDVKGQLRAIFGGGRYARLLSSIGGNDRTAVGLGFGDVVVAEILAERNLQHPDTQRNGYQIGCMQNDQMLTTTSIAAALRKQGQTVNLTLSPIKPKAFFAKADHAQARFAILIGSDDLADGTIRIKDLASREEKKVCIRDMLEMQTP